MRDNRNFLLLIIVCMTCFAGACAVSGNSSSLAGKNPTPPIGSENINQTVRPETYSPDGRQINITESIKLSKWIVLVKAISSEAREVSSKNIFTFSEFEVLESAKEAYPDKTLTLRVVGGEVDGVTVTKPYSIDFEKDRKYVLFLGEKNKFGYPTIDPQNIYAVEVDGKTNLEVVTPEPNLPLYDPKTGNLHTKKLIRTPLDDFLYSIRKVK